MAASYLSKLNPVPAFAEYTGPYKVGTVDVEIPVGELASPAPAPAGAAEIETVQFRVFYPAPAEASGKPITWLPAPQRHHLTAYIKFLGVGALLAEAVSFLPRHLHYTTVPVVKNAPLLAPPTANNRWPTVVFSHGLGGSRNAYSQMAGSLASHGLVVVCPEHRDGSAVASFVRLPAAQDSYFLRNTRRAVPYRRIPHEATAEVHALRCDQLRVRLWELGLVHAALLGFDEGADCTNLNRSTPPLRRFFAGRLHVHEPGSITFAGHSFGAATTVQFLKSVYYAGSPALAAMEQPLYAPAPDSALCRQVTPRNVTILLDLWCFPLLAADCQPLFDLPLPVYAADAPSAPGGAHLLAVESQDFYKWTEHLHVTARVLSPEPAAPVVRPAAYERASGARLPEPHFFYVHHSAHLNQSDFGLLFPWLTKKIFGSAAPERALRLNLRAALQVLRAAGVPVARTGPDDLVDGAYPAGGKEKEAAVDGGPGAGHRADGAEDGVLDDPAILARAAAGGPVEAWSWIDIDGMGAAGQAAGDDKAGGAAEAREPAMADRIEPQVSQSDAVHAVVGNAATTASA